MKKFAIWFVATIILAAIFHLVGVWYLPGFITQTTVNRIFKNRGIGYNQMNYGEMRSALKDTVPMENPDSKTTFAAYDVSDKPVRIKCVVPETGNYWSISLYAWNTDNFYVVNDRTALAKEFDLVLVKTNSRYQKADNEEVVIVPRNKGVMLIRMLVNDRNDKEELVRLTEFQKQTVIQIVDTEVY